MNDLFTSLLKPHLRDLQTSARTFTGNRHDGEDLLQQSLLTAYRFFDKFERGTNFGGWVYTIMKNQFRNNCRKHVPFHQTIDDKDRTYYVNSIELSCPAQNYEEIFSDEVCGALYDLSLQNLEILILADVEELSLFDISKQMDIGERTIRSKLRRARNKVEGRLLEYAQANGYKRGNRLTSSPKRKRITLQLSE